MSFAKIAEARAVRKIVLMIRNGLYAASPVHASEVAELIAARIERGEWRDIVLPKRRRKRN